MAKVKLGHRMMRALFLGIGIGLFGGLGVYIIAEGVNALVGAPVLNSIAFLEIVLGGTIFSSLGVEWSSDIEEQAKA